MKRAATWTMKRNEELNAQSDLPLAPGLVIVLDLDRFGEYVESRGLDPYKPNLVTGELSRLVESFAIKHRGVVVYGLDWERGTEEAVIEIPFGDEEVGSILRDLEELKKSVEQLGASITIVVVRDYVLAKPAPSRREAYYGTPGRARALKLLRSAKRRGGGKIVTLV